MTDWGTVVLVIVAVGVAGCALHEWPWDRDNATPKEDTMRALRYWLSFLFPVKVTIVLTGIDYATEGNSGPVLLHTTYRMHRGKLGVALERHLILPGPALNAFDREPDVR